MADNYTALKSSQKKRIISKETFNSLDLSTIPVGSEYEVVSPIEKGDLSADINNALNKAEKSISEPTNQTTGSDGDVLVKKGGGSEWKSNAAFTDNTNEFSKMQFFGYDDHAAPGGNTFHGVKISEEGVEVASDNGTTGPKVVLSTESGDGFVAVANNGNITGPGDVNGFQSSLEKDKLIIADSGNHGAATLKFDGSNTSMINPVLYLPPKNGTLTVDADLNSLETKLNENIIKDPHKTYLVWHGPEFPASEDAQFKAPVNCTIDWGDGNVEHFRTTATEVTTHTYTDGKDYHLISIAQIDFNENAFYNAIELQAIYLGKDVQVLNDNCLSGTSCESITIPAAAHSLGNKCIDSKVVIFESPNPPDMLIYDAFSSIPDKIIVPKSAVSTYMSAVGNWTKYTDKIVYETDSSDLNLLQAKLNENAIKDSSKTYLVVNGNVQSAVDLGSNVVYDVDWGDGIVQTSQTTKLSHTYADGYAYHLVTITSTSEYCKNLFAGLTSLIKIIVGTSTPLFLNNNYIAFEGDTNLEEIDLSHCGNSLISDTTLDLSTTKVNKLILPKNLDNTPAQSSGWLIANLVEELTIPVTLATMYVLNGKGYLKGLKKLYLPRTESILTLSGSYASIPDDCKVIVPKSLISAYKSAAGWSMIADKIVYEVDSSDLPDMSNVAETDKENSFTKAQTFGDIKIENNEISIYKNGKLNAQMTRAQIGLASKETNDLTYDWYGFSTWLSRDSLVIADPNFGAATVKFKVGGNSAPIIYLPQANGTLALTSDVDAKSSFSVEVW